MAIISDAYELAPIIPELPPRYCFCGQRLSIHNRGTMCFRHTDAVQAERQEERLERGLTPIARNRNGTMRPLKPARNSRRSKSDRKGWGA